MKFVNAYPLADPDLAARKLIEIDIERVNLPFLEAGGTGHQFRAGIERAIAQGLLWRHESGTYVKLTESGAALFA